jgi:hypothetical protein
MDALLYYGGFDQEVGNMSIDCRCMEDPISTHTMGCPERIGGPLSSYPHYPTYYDTTPMVLPLCML